MMTNHLVHGCYDRATLITLKELGIKRVAFDLRARSPNLIPFRDLLTLLKELDSNSAEVVLIFQNDKRDTVLSFLDMLKTGPFKIVLEFRDQNDLSYYHSLNAPFLWMFHPDADWKNILILPTLKGVLLPLKWRNEYKIQTELWEIIEHRNLEVYLHSDNLEEASELSDLSGVNLSMDLTSEVEKSYRCVDQERLKKMKIWSMLNEIIAL